MTIKLQQFEQDRSNYERPNQKWVCGHLADGKPCAIGPDGSSCRATTECNPIRKGDRYHCARARQRGGACEDGPRPDGTCCIAVPPCQPVRSIRSKRGVFVFTVLAGVLGLIVLMLTSEDRATWMSPGPLGLQHAQILAKQTDDNSVRANDCATCHVGGDRQLGELLMGAFGFVEHTEGEEVDPAFAITQSVLCLQCHGASPGFDEENSLFPHAIAPDVLASRTTANAQAAADRHTHSEPGVVTASLTSSLSSATLRLPPPIKADGQIACASCHREHRGTQFDLKAISNRQCQACHTEAFHSFNDGHPDFTNFPYDRRTRLIFDHTAHQSRYFPEANRFFQCDVCHQPDRQGQAMLARSFEQNCASCHVEKINTSLASGVPMLRLPGVDNYILKQEGINIGQWPSEAEIDIDGRLTPFMQLLLSSDPAAATALASLGPNFIYNDIETATDEQKRAVAAVAWAVKSLIFDLTIEGQDALIDRIEYALGRPINPAEASALTAQLPAEALTSLQAAWYPNLLTEVPLKRSGLFPGANQQPENQPSPTTPIPPTPQPETPVQVAVAPAIDPTTGDDTSLLGGDDTSLLSNPTPTPAPANTNTQGDDTSLLSDPTQTPAPNTPATTTPATPQQDDASLLSDPEPTPATTPNTTTPAPTPTQTPTTQPATQPSPTPTRQTPPTTVAVNTVEPAPSRPAPVRQQPVPVQAVPQPEPQPTRPAPAAAPAAAADATIVRIFGTVQYRLSPTDAWKIATEGLELPNEAEIRTGVGASVRFRLRNGRLARLLSIASVKISEANVGKISRRLEYDPPDSGSADDLFTPSPFPPGIWESAFESILTYQDDTSLLGGDDDSSLLGGDDNSLLGGDDNSLLGGDDDNSLLGGDDDNSLLGGDDNSLLGGDDDNSLLGGSPAGNPDSNAGQTQPRPSVPAATPNNADQRVRAGGWFRDDITYALSYRPTGHADQFLRAWITLGLAAAERPEPDPLRSVGSELSQPTATGQCVKCHSIDSFDNSAALAINWQQKRRDRQSRSFNRFVHAPHLIQPHLATCTHCHSFSAEGDYISSFDNHDPHTFTSSFKPLARNVCADCHRPEAANASCLNCHNYHVGGSLTEAPVFAPLALPSASVPR